MKKFTPLVLLLLLIHQTGLAQSVESSITSLAGSKGQLPFWLWADQLGRYDRETPFILNLNLDARYSHNWDKSSWGVEAGSSFDVLLNTNSPLRFTELFGGVNWRFLQLTVGAFAEEEKYLGLSASNGNLAATRNARPHPKVRAGFNRFVPLFFPWFSVYGFYEEGLLNDERFVKNTHLHHKALYVRFGNPENVNFSAGIEHFVMWGGTHPVYGELPGWDSYFSYVLGLRGSSNSVIFDQQNVLGNQYGVYQLEFQKKWEQMSFYLYISHPFEDHSGMELDNLPDNLYGIFLKNNGESTFLEGISIEYYYTKDQSGPYGPYQDVLPNETKKGRGRDNYFNHGIYLSGATYQQMAMVSPFFIPQSRIDSVSMEFESTRFSGFHVGATGSVSNSIRWKTMMSAITQAGNYDDEGKGIYNPPRKQFSSLFHLEWQKPKSPFNIGVSVAGDHGSVFDAGEITNRWGLQLSFKWLIY